MLTWERTDDYLFGYQTQTCTQYSKCLFFDLDSTLIKTKSGKKFPVDSNDWTLLYDCVQEKLQHSYETNCLIGIISNQKGLGDTKKQNAWIDKINYIVKILPVHFVFACTSDSIYRKPMDGSYTFVKQHYRYLDWNVLEKKTWYIGDAFGRETDFSDTDVKFAHNCLMKFRTPEVFFGLEKITQSESGTITYPVLNYYKNGFLHTRVWTKIKGFIDEAVSTGKHIYIMTCGFPASGKSYIRKVILEQYPEFSYTNNDDISNNVGNTSLVKLKGVVPDLLVDDNTNMNVDQVIDKLKKFNDYAKIMVWFDYSLDVAFHLNWVRAYWFNCPLVSKIAYYSLNKKFGDRGEELGKYFDNVVKVNRIFKEFDMSHKTSIKYYF